MSETWPNAALYIEFWNLNRANHFHAGLDGHDGVRAGPLTLYWGRGIYSADWILFFVFFLLRHRVLATLINTGCECCCFYYLCIGAGIWGRKRGWAVAAGPPITFIYYAAALTRPKAFPIRRCQIFSRRQQCLKDLQLPSKIRQYYKSPVVWLVWCQAVKTVWYWLIASIPLFNDPAVIWLQPKLANLTLLLFFFFFFFERSLPPLTWLEVRFVLDHFPGNKKNNNNKTQGHLKASQNSCYGAISFQTL